MTAAKNDVFHCRRQRPMFKMRPTEISISVIKTTDDVLTPFLNNRKSPQTLPPRPSSLGSRTCPQGTKINSTISSNAPSSLPPTCLTSPAPQCLSHSSLFTHLLTHYLFFLFFTLFFSPPGLSLHFLLLFHLFLRRNQQQLLQSQ